MALYRISLALLLALQAPSDAAGPPPDGYRLQHYRAPTPDSLPGATVLDTATLATQLAADKPPLLLDVMAASLLGSDGGPRRWLPREPRRHLPGSHWLPNVGLGAPDAALEQYFRRELARLSGGDAERALVFYCLRDCWLSWNAARRALAYGYRRVYWYPDGSDGWAEAGLPLVAGEPQPW